MKNTLLLVNWYIDILVHLIRFRESFGETPAACIGPLALPGAGVGNSSLAVF